MYCFSISDFPKKMSSQQKKENVHQEKDLYDIISEVKYRENPLLLFRYSVYGNFDLLWDKFAGSLLKKIYNPTPELSDKLLKDLEKLELKIELTTREIMSRNNKSAITAKEIATKPHSYIFYNNFQILASPSNSALIDNAIFHSFNSTKFVPVHSVIFIFKYFALGLITGTIVASMWRFGFHIPQRKRADAYYKRLYEDNPEYWPALAQQKYQDAKRFVKLI